MSSEVLTLTVAERIVRSWVSWGYWESQSGPAKGEKHRINWNVVIIMLVLHIMSVVAVFQFAFFCYTHTIWEILKASVTFAVVWEATVGFCVTGGAHRLWSHRSYKASYLFRVYIMLGFTSTLQESILKWAKTHRVHHKTSETDDDPHDARRGMFFAHMGWMFLRHRDGVIKQLRAVPLADLKADPVVMFNHRHYFKLVLFTTYMHYCIGKWATGDRWLSITVFVAFRIVSGWHQTWVINSLAHYHGEKPYDKHQHAVESLPAAVLSRGEGWHNYHHAFPEDYATSEYGIMTRWNPTKMWIDVANFFGLAWGRRRASKSLVAKVKADPDWTRMTVFKEKSNRKVTEILPNDTMQVPPIIAETTQLLRKRSVAAGKYAADTVTEAADMVESNTRVLRSRVVELSTQAGKYLEENVKFDEHSGPC